MEKRIYYLSNTVIPNTKREKNIHVFNVFTQVGVKQLTDFLRTVTPASDFVDCTLVNCAIELDLFTAMSDLVFYAFKCEFGYFTKSSHSATLTKLKII